MRCATLCAFPLVLAVVDPAAAQKAQFGRGGRVVSNGVISAGGSERRPGRGST